MGGNNCFYQSYNVNIIIVLGKSYFEILLGFRIGYWFKQYFF